MEYITLIIGFIFLIKGADIFVGGASAIARKFNISNIIIGLTIVAIGKSTPELSVSISSSLIGQNDMSIANVVGSNIFNTLIILGICSLLCKLNVEKSTLKKDIPFLILANILLLVFTFDKNLNKVEGIIFLLIFIIFILRLIKSNKHNNISNTLTENNSLEISFSKNTIYIILGLIGVIWGGNLVVDSASIIAKNLGMSDNLIGLTIMAIGTSLPELVTSIIAIKRGENDIAIGNVIGSNIFNIFLILGLVSFINPIPINIITFIDIIFMSLVTILLYLVLKFKNSIAKSYGVYFIVLYLIYMIHSIIR